MNSITLVDEKEEDFINRIQNNTVLININNFLIPFNACSIPFLEDKHKKTIKEIIKTEIEKYGANFHAAVLTLAQKYNDIENYQKAQNTNTLEKYVAELLDYHLMNSEEN